MPEPSAVDPCSKRLTWQELDPSALKQLIAHARDEDLAGWGLNQRPEPSVAHDVSSALLPTAHPGSASLVARSAMVVCGLRLLPLIAEVYRFELQYDSSKSDGQTVAKGDVLGRLHGPAQQILQMERVALNFVQMLSGVSTETRRYVEALGNSPTRLLDTRKTLPGYRMLQKYAVACGGGWNHRLGLFDRVMLKDNHLAATGSTAGDRLFETVRRARETQPNLLIEVEVDRIDQIEPAIEAGAHILLLDNFDNDALRDAVARIAGRVRTEASGGITIERLPSMANLGLDYISTGATVHQCQWQDIGLDWD